MQNRSGYNSLEKIGSTHWYRTLCCNLSSNLKGLQEEKLKEHHEKWLNASIDIVKDLIEAYDEGLMNEDTRKIKEILKVIQS